MESNCKITKKTEIGARPCAIFLNRDFNSFPIFAPMKRRFFLGLLSLLALAACHSPQREARLMVRRAERLADTLPDSTARLIDSVLRMPVYFGEKRRMDMALLQAEALLGDRGQEIPPLMDDDFFDDKPFFSTSPELESAADYYAKKKQYTKAAHAALYSGFVQQHYGEKAAAMQLFKEAEHYGKLAGDSLTMARAEYKMGKMLYYDGLVRDVITILKDSERHFDNRFAEKALVQNLIGACHLLQGDFASTGFYLQQSLMNAEIGYSNKVINKALNNYAVAYQLQGEYARAIKCLKQIADKHNSDNSELLLYINLGNVYMESQKMDSASLYYKLVDSLLPTAKTKIETQLAAYDALSKFAKRQNNDSLAFLYCSNHENVLYTIMQRRQEQSIYRIQQQYDYENLQNILNRKIITRHRIILIISILLFVSAVLIIILQFRHRQMREAETEMKRQIDSLKSDLRESVKATYLEHELSSRLRLIVLACRTQKEAYDPKHEWTPIVNRLTNGKKSAFEAVAVEMEKVYPNLYAALRQKYPDLNETETKVCLLSFSDLSNTEMADILGISKHTVDKNRSKLRDKLNLKPERMKEQLHKMLSN